MFFGRAPSYRLCHSALRAQNDESQEFRNARIKVAGCSKLYYACDLDPLPVAEKENYNEAMIPPVQSRRRG